MTKSLVTPFIHNTSCPVHLCLPQCTHKVQFCTKRVSINKVQKPRQANWGNAARPLWASKERLNRLIRLLPNVITYHPVPGFDHCNSCRCSFLILPNYLHTQTKPLERKFSHQMCNFHLIFSSVVVITQSLPSPRYHPTIILVIIIKGSLLRQRIFHYAPIHLVILVCRPQSCVTAGELLVCSVLCSTPTTTKFSTSLLSKAGSTRRGDLESTSWFLRHSEVKRESHCWLFPSPRTNFLFCRQ